LPPVARIGGQDVALRTWSATSMKPLRVEMPTCKSIGQLAMRSTLASLGYGLLA
jgi:hypothetical protein